MVNIFTRLSPSFAFSETQGGDFLSTDSVAFILIYSFAFFALLIFVGFKAAKKGWDIFKKSRKTGLWSRCRMEQSRDESRFSIPRENVFPRMNSNQASRLPPCGHPWCRSEKKGKEGWRKKPLLQANSTLGSSEQAGWPAASLLWEALERRTAPSCLPWARGGTHLPALCSCWGCWWCWW